MVREFIKTDRCLTYTMILSLVLIVVIYFFKALGHAIDVPVFHLDGAFQTASTLFRIDSGQAPGQDFLPYLGVGPTFLLYPLFLVSGGTLSASLFTTYFMTFILGWIAVSTIWHFIFCPKTIKFSLVSGGIVFMATVIVFFYLHKIRFPYQYLSLDFPYSPGNSLKPIRAIIPYLVAIASYYLLKRCKFGYKRDIIFGIIASVVLLWSNDFAMPTAGLLGFIYLSILYFNENPSWKSNAITFCITSFILWSLLLFLTTAGHPFKLIKYNFIDVAKDQWWYFGPYSPDRRVFGFDQISKIIYKYNYFPLIVLLSTIIVTFKTRKIEHALLAWIGSVLFFGGSLASLGGHLGGYFFAFSYWGSMMIFLVFLKAFKLFLDKKLILSPKESNFIVSGLPFFVLFSLIVAASGTWINYRMKVLSAQNDPNKFYVPELGGYLDTEWKNYIDYARQHKDSIVTEEYWGIWSSFNKQFPLWPVDSVIHALGDVRNVAKSSLIKSDLIISSRYSVSPIWQPWSLSQNFWFYDELLSNREPYFVSPTTIVWGRTDTSRIYKKVGCYASKVKKGFIIESESYGFYRVTLNYKSTGGGRHLLMIQNNISNGPYAEGFISLPLDKTQEVFPVLINKNTDNFFELKVHGGNGVDYKIESCTAEIIPYKNNKILYDSSLDHNPVTK